MKNLRIDTDSLNAGLRRLGLPALWAWWLEQLRALLPAWLLRLAGLQQGRLQCLPLANGGFEFRLRRPGAPARSLGIVAAEGNRADITRLVGGQGDLERGVELLVPAARCFSRPISLPLATEQNLQSVLRYEMDRQTPFSSDQVYFAHDVADRDTEAQRLRVALVVVPRAVVDDALEQLRGFGLRMRAAYPEEDPLPETPAEWFNLLPSSLGGGTTSWATRRRQLAAATTVIVLAVALALPLWQHRGIAIAHMQAVQELSPQMQRLSRLQDRRDHLHEALDEPARIQTAQLSSLDLLAEVTERLPDDTWLTSLRFDDDELRMEGEAASASRLIQRLEESSVLGNVRFLTSVQRRGDGRERFSIGTEVRPRPDMEDGS